MLLVMPGPTPYTYLYGDAGCTYRQIFKSIKKSPVREDQLVLHIENMNKGITTNVQLDET